VYSDSAASFVGFYSTGASIASMSITSGSLAGGSLYPTVDNLYFASVPAPGALALLGLAGLTARRRVRR
jgi:MYXO-CTERM domain-containing protein